MIKKRNTDILVISAFPLTANLKIFLETTSKDRIFKTNMREGNSYFGKIKWKSLTTMK